MLWLRASLLAVLVTFAPVVGRAAEPYWPQWRGPDGQGHSSAKNVPVSFSDTEHVAWKLELPGRGHSSPVIGGGQVWVTTAIASPLTEEERRRRLAKNTGNQPLELSGPLSLRAVGVDLKTGQLLHDVELLVESDPQWTHSLNSFASPSPVWEEGRLYCHFGAHGSAALDTATGRVLWTNRDPALVVQHENGPGSTPVVWGDLVIFHLDGSDRQSIAALDKHTGRLAWQTTRSGEMHADPQTKKAYGTPLITRLDERDVLLSPAADWLYAYDPATGRELWRVAYGGLGFSIVPRPVVAHGMAYVCTSFMRSELLAIELDGPKSRIAWRFAKQAPQKPSPLVVGNEIYLFGDRGVATCLDARTGQELWTERLGGNFSSSPLLADGRIYIGNHEGKMFVLEPGREHRELAANQLDGALMATPAAIDGALIVRTDKALYRLGQ